MRKSKRRDQRISRRRSSSISGDSTSCSSSSSSTGSSDSCSSCTTCSSRRGSNLLSIDMRCYSSSSGIYGLILCMDIWDV